MKSAILIAICFSGLIFLQNCLYDSENSDPCAKSDFKISSPAIGDSLLPGATIAIQWASCLEPAPRKVNLILLNESDSIIALAIETENDGTFSWDISEWLPEGNNYAILIEDTDNNKISGQSSTFTISQSSPFECPDGEDVTILSPNQGDEFLEQEYLWVNWKFCGNSPNEVHLRLYESDSLIGSLTMDPVLNDGEFKWIIPDNFPYNNNLQIDIANTEDGDRFAISGYFDIASRFYGSYTIFNDLEDSVFVMGDEIILDYKLEGNVGNNTSSYRLNVFLESADGDSWQLRNRVPMDGSVKVALNSPIVEGDGFRFKIQNSYAANVFSYSEPFSIEPWEFTSPMPSDSIQAGTLLNITWQGSSFEIISLDLLKGTELSKHISNTSSLKYNYTLPSHLVAGEDYYIQLGTLDENERSITRKIGPFTILNPYLDNFEPDNNLEEATEINYLGIVQNHTLASRESDYMRLITKIDWVYKINLQAVSNLNFDLVNTKGRTISGYGKNNDNVTWWYRNSDKVDTIFILVSGNSSSIGKDYSAYVQGYDPNGLIEFISPNYSTSWNAGATVPVEWAVDSSLFGSEVSINLIYLNQKIAILNPHTPNDGRKSVTLPDGAGTDAKYKIQIANLTNPTIIGYSQEFGLVGIAQDELEPNNSPLYASTIEANSSQLNLTLPFMDEDWFQFSADSGKIYEIKIHSEKQPSLELFLNNGKTDISEIQITSDDSSRHYFWYCNKDDDYKVRISDSIQESFKFTLFEFSENEYRFQVTNPINAGSYQVGTVVPITWEDNLGLDGLVNLLLFDGEELVSTIRVNTKNDGSYDWQIPSDFSSSDKYLVRVSHVLSPNIYGESKLFAITE